MDTDWQLIRSVMNGVLDACERMEALQPDLYAGEYEVRSDYQEDVCVGDFLTRFWQYPEGAQRDIIRLRTALGCDQKHPAEVSRALVAAAMACAEAIGVPEEALGSEVEGFEPHCGSGGRSIRSQLEGIPAIQNGWMLTGVSRALAEFRKPHSSDAAKD
jgi:hypothetical protein